MSLTLIAVIGILVGFLCLVVGFFMEDAKGSRDIGVLKERRGINSARKKIVVPRKKVA